MKKIYIVRHCKAEGQASEAPLTASGQKQALDLAEFFQHIPVERIISSPFRRAIDSIKDSAEKLSLQVETDNRLAERILSSKDLPDWLDKLKKTYEDKQLSFEGGESSAVAAKRIITVVDEIFKCDAKRSIIVTHGNIMSLLLNYFDNEFGFDKWCQLSNPDVFCLNLEDGSVSIEHLWSR